MKKKLLLLPLFVLGAALLQGQVTITAHMGQTTAEGFLGGTSQIVLPGAGTGTVNLASPTAFQVDFGGGGVADFTISQTWDAFGISQWNGSLEAGSNDGNLVITLTSLTNVSALTYDGFGATSVDGALMVTATAPGGGSVTVNDNGSFTNTSNAGAWTAGQTLTFSQEAGWPSGSYNLRSFGVTGTVVPEPSTYALLLGLGCLGFVIARRRK